MFGAIIGDIVGSVYEFHNFKTERPEEIELFNAEARFTDDSVMTIAIADAILTGRDYADAVDDWGNRYPWSGYGGGFARWLRAKEKKPYGSWGNGSAMRVSPIGWAFETLEETLVHAKRSAEFTHNHVEGIKGAQAAASALFLARAGASKQELKAYVEHEFDYNLDRTTAEIRPHYQFNESCQGTVPEAIIVFLESADFLHAVKLAVSIGGDTDTIACIAGGIAEAFYKRIPTELVVFAEERLTSPMKVVIKTFRERFMDGDVALCGDVF
ncbi:MAG: ADP-ribosylglycohydrolase family protein [Treponema sp.]|jgi:ADP-ribosylglycohydrolase|nr:ADP-ribosylglycohydrolase family protein [Treponema sp.]